MMENISFRNFPPATAMNSKLVSNAQRGQLMNQMSFESKDSVHIQSVKFGTRKTDAAERKEDQRVKEAATRDVQAAMSRISAKTIRDKNNSGGTSVQKWQAAKKEFIDVAKAQGLDPKETGLDPNSHSDGEDN